MSPTMDAYFGAILIPYTLYLIIVVGTLSPVFIPILLQEGTSLDKASEAFSVVTTFTLVLMAAVVTLSMSTAVFWLPWLFPGFSPSTSAMLVRLVYIIYPAVIFLTMAGIFNAVLNGFHKFALAAITPALSSMAVIAAAILARGSKAIYIVGLATTLGFVLQFLVLVPAVAALGIRYRPTFNYRHPAILKVLRLGGPLFLYLLVSNAVSIIERNLASKVSAGAVSAMTYAVRLFGV
ncbi:MAG: lipid II flippase MurJ, partial [Terriglobales bacterium]